MNLMIILYLVILYLVISDDIVPSDDIPDDDISAEKGLRNRRFEMENVELNSCQEYYLEIVF